MVNVFFATAAASSYRTDVPKTSDERMATPPSTNDPSARLTALRNRLDAVDTGIHRLLRERFEIVEEIGAAKGPHEAVIRPAREAAVIENRLALHSGAMPKEMLAHLWRTLITAACTIQRPFAVHTAGAIDVALYLYGPIPVTVHETAEAAIAALGEGDVAVVSQDLRWWDITAGASVICRCATTSGPGALVFAGSGVTAGTGPEAAVVREGRPLIVSASEIGPDDRVLGRYHPFPIEIPAARTSAP